MTTYVLNTSTLTFTFNVGAGSPPASPTTLTAYTISTSRIDLTWTDNSTSPDETGFIVEQSLDGLTGWTLVITTAANVTSYSVTGLTSGTVYYFRVRATISGTDSGNSNVASDTTAGSLGPAAPAISAATALSPTAVRLDLTGTGAIGTDVVTIESSSDGGASWSGNTQVYSPVSTFVASGLTANTPYKFRAIRNNLGTAPDGPHTSIPSTPVTAISTPAALLAVTAPTLLVVSNLTPCSAVISWTPQADRIEDGYYVERSADSGSTWRVVAANLMRGCTYFKDIGLTPGVSTYQWRVTAFNGRTQTGPTSATFTHSATLTQVGTTTTPAASGSLPTAPTWQSYSGITGAPTGAMAVSDTVVALEWQLNAEDEVGTKVEYSTDGGTTWIELFVVGKWIWNCQVVGLTAATPYKFRLRTTNTAGDSAYTSILSVTTLAAATHYTLGATAPKLFLTPQQLAIFGQMQADYNANTASPATIGGQLYKFMKTAADGAVTWNTGGGNLGVVYLDVGQWSAFMYQITGTQAYADAAYALALSTQNVNGDHGGWLSFRGDFLSYPGNSGNWGRDVLPIAALIFDWCAPAWTPTQRSTFLAGADRLLTSYLTWNGNLYYIKPIEVGPNTVSNINGHLTGPFGLGLWDALFAGSDSQAGYYTQQSVGGFNVPMGGVQPSLASQNGTLDYSTGISEMAGTWASWMAEGLCVESSEYNLLTCVIFNFLADAFRMARSAFGDNNEYHPATRTQVRHHALAEMAHFAPDLKQIVQWGDEQTARVIGNNSNVNQRMELQGLTAGTARGNATIAPFCLGFFNELWNKANVPPWGASTSPYYRDYLMMNPYGATQPRSALPNAYLAKSAGNIFYHTGYGVNDTLYFSSFLRPSWVDHTPNWVGDFQIYRKGEWVFTHPQAYQTPVQEGEGANAMLIGGLSCFGGTTFLDAPAGADPTGFRGLIAAETGTSPTYVYTIGGTWGMYYSSPGYYLPPPAFCFEWTRSTVYLPGSDAKSDTVVCFDRTLASNPNFLPDGLGTGGTGVAHYNDANRITSNPLNTGTAPYNTGTPALKQWIFHNLTSPTVVGQVVTWSTTNSNLKLVNLLPAGPTIQVYDESVYWVPPQCTGNYFTGVGTVGGQKMLASEAHYQTRIWPSTPWPVDATPTWDVFLNVLFASDISGGPTCSATTITSSSPTSMVGTLVKRTSLNDTLVMFSQVASTRSAGVTTFNRVLSSGTTIAWTSTSANTDVLLFDLDPNHAFHYTLDGGGSTVLTVTSNGSAKLAVAGATAHTLVLT